MLRAIVVDDEHLTMELICAQLKHTNKIEVMGGYTNPYKALEWILVHKPDVVFLDIEMPELNGLQLAERIYESELSTEIVFITAYNAYALEAFKVNALDYLLKPVVESELLRSVERVEKRRQTKILTVSTSQRVRVQALGGFSLWISGEKEPLKWLTVKCREMMAYFVFHGISSEVSKWKLIELFWPDRDPKKGEVNLRSTVCRLNKTLRDYGTTMRLVSKRNRYILEANGIAVDALEMEQLSLSENTIDISSLREYEEAFFSYKGCLFEGFEFSWCEELRTYFQRHFINLARKLAVYYMDTLKNYVSALNTVEALLKYEPYDEEAHFIAFRLIFITRGKEAANQYYEKIVRLYSEDLGIEESPLLQRIHQGLMND